MKRAERTQRVRNKSHNSGRKRMMFSPPVESEQNTTVHVIIPLVKTTNVSTVTDDVVNAAARHQMVAASGGRT
jgi:hypothetical protein